MPSETIDMGLNRLGLGEITELKCDICGATQKVTGEPFKNERAVLIHKRMIHDGGAKKGVRNRRANRRSSPREPRVTNTTKESRLVHFCCVCGSNVDVMERAMEIANETN